MRVDAPRSAPSRAFLLKKVSAAKSLKLNKSTGAASNVPSRGSSLQHQKSENDSNSRRSALRSWLPRGDVLQIGPPLRPQFVLPTLARSHTPSDQGRSMSNFARVIRIALRHRSTVAAAILCSLVVAVLWAGSITAVLPIVDGVMHGKSIPDLLRRQDRRAPRTNSPSWTLVVTP